MKWKTMKWDEEIQSWGFEWVNDFAERACVAHNGGEISIMAFEDDEFEVCWIMPGYDHPKEQCVVGMEALKSLVDELRK